jgi:hypothetical protein
MASRYITVPLNFAGGTNKNRSRLLNSSNAINLYTEAQGSTSNATVVLQSFPGLKLFGAPDDITFEAGGDNGIHRMANEVVYRVVQGRLYRVIQDGTHTFINTIEDNATFANPIEGLVSFADDGVWIVMVYRSANDGFFKVKAYNTETQQLVFVVDPESAIVNAESVSFLNNQFIYTTRRFFFVSDITSPIDVNGLNGAGAESYGDDIVRGYVFKQALYLYGKRTVETWFNSGVGNPPFERVEGQILNVGLVAKFSVANNDNFMYFLGDDRRVYASNGSQADKISNNSVTSQIEQFETIDDAVGFCFSFENQNFFAITFPTEQKTFCFNETIGADLGWFELSSSAFFERDEKYYNIYKCFSSVDAFGKIIMPAVDSNKLYELDINTFLNDDEIIRRERTFPTINGSTLGEIGKRVQMSRFELIVEKGVGNINGDGIDPQIIVEFSFDGGKTFSNGSWMKIGRLGQTNIKAECFKIQSFYDLIIRIKCTDPVLYTIISASIDLKAAGR